VGPASQGAQYQTISAAVTAAEADTRPITIFVLPGTYNENVTINRDGISLHGFAGYAFQTQIAGNVTFTAADLISMHSIEELNILGTLELQGTNQLQVWATEIAIQVNLADDALVISNTNSSSQFLARDFRAVATGSGLCINSTSGSSVAIELRGFFLRTGGGTTNQFAVSIDGQAAPNQSTLQAQSGQIEGRVRALNSSTFAIADGSVRALSDSPLVVHSNPLTTCSISNSVLLTTGGLAQAIDLSAGGSIIYGDTYPFGGAQWPAPAPTLIGLDNRSGQFNGANIRSSATPAVPTGNYLDESGEYFPIGGGGGTPAGGQWQAQFNDAGAFAASNKFLMVPPAGLFQVGDGLSQAQIQINGAPGTGSVFLGNDLANFQVGADTSVVNGMGFANFDAAAFVGSNTPISVFSVEQFQALITSTTSLSMEQEFATFTAAGPGTGFFVVNNYDSFVAGGSGSSGVGFLGLNGYRDADLQGLGPGAFTANGYLSHNLQGNGSPTSFLDASFHEFINLSGTGTAIFSPTFLVENQDWIRFEGAGNANSRWEINGGFSDIIFRGNLLGTANSGNFTIYEHSSFLYGDAISGASTGEVRWNQVDSFEIRTLPVGAVPALGNQAIKITDDTAQSLADKKALRWNQTISANDYYDPSQPDENSNAVVALAIPEPHETYNLLMTSGVARVVNLQGPSVPGATILIKEYANSAAPIVVNASAGTTIDGIAFKSIVTAYGYMRIIGDESGNWAIDSERGVV
tara:strand:+ start:2356 stop:4602 length:2247 start_codon:yes stop_codon:yes gene_type:complete